VDDWIGTFLPRNRLLEHVIGGKIKSSGRGGRRRRQLRDDFKKEKRYLNVK
jgi:hypothetical protein